MNARNPAGLRAFRNAQRHRFRYPQVAALIRRGPLQQTGPDLSASPVNQNSQTSSHIDSQIFSGEEHARRTLTFRGYQNGQASSVINSQTSGSGQQTPNSRVDDSSSSLNNRSLYSEFQPQWQRLQAPGNRVRESQSRDDRGIRANNHASFPRTALPHRNGQGNTSRLHHDNEQNVIRHPLPVVRHQGTQNWGLKCPIRPPTPSEGAAQVRHDIQKLQGQRLTYLLAVQSSRRAAESAHDCS